MEAAEELIKKNNILTLTGSLKCQALLSAVYTFYLLLLTTVNKQYYYDLYFK